MIQVALLNSDFFNKKWWLLFKTKKKFLDGASLRPGWIVRVVPLQPLCEMQLTYFSRRRMQHWPHVKKNARSLSDWSSAVKSLSLMTNSEFGTKIQIHKNLTISLFLWPDKSTPKTWRFKKRFDHNEGTRDSQIFEGPLSIAEKSCDQAQVFESLLIDVK